MAKEFDVYLNRRLLQCDIIVRSIPFRDGLTVIDRMILNSCLEDCMLQRVIAVQSGSELVSKIDNIIKTCMEKLDHGVIMDANVDIQSRYSIRPATEQSLEMSSELPRIVELIQTSASNKMRIAESAAYAYIKRPFGKAQSEMEIRHEDAETFKQCFERAAPGIVLTADLLRTKKQVFENISGAVIPNQEVTDLLYRFYIQAEDSWFSIMTECLDAEIHFSLGRSSFQVVMDSQMLCPQMTLFAEAENAVEVSSSASATLSKSMEQEQSTMVVTAEVAAVTKRFRIVHEMDDDNFSVYDNMTLDDVDFVVLK